MMYYAKKDNDGRIVQVGTAETLPEGFEEISEAEYQAWLAALPPEEEPGPTAMERARADIDFLLAMAGVTE